MDPQATLKRIFEAIDDNDIDEFAYAMLDLYNWLEKGGFPPIVTKLPKNTKRIATTTAHSHLIDGKILAIQCTDDTIDTEPKVFEFVCYQNDTKKVYPLPTK